MDNFLHFKKLEILEDAVELLVASCLWHPKDVLEDLGPRKRSQAIQQKLAFDVVQSNLLWRPDELTDAMVEVRGKKAENQISEEKDFGHNQDVLADRPHALTLAQST